MYTNSQNTQRNFSTTAISNTTVPSPMSIADELLDTLYDGATPEPERCDAHHVWLTWFRKQPAWFQYQAVARYRARREKNFVSMYDAAVSP